jgi:hypothetical protein
MKRVKFIFAWYDLWIGIFWDAKKRWLYIFPIPMFGVRIDLQRRFPMHVFGLLFGAPANGTVVCADRGFLGDKIVVIKDGKKLTYIWHISDHWVYAP